MAGFSADGIVEALDYDLNPYVDAKGVIQEPTSLQVQTFQTATMREANQMRLELGGDRGDDAPLTTSEILAFLAKLDPERQKAALKRQADMFSALCSGKPTAAQFLKMPHRPMLAFANWISGELLNPEASAAGGKAVKLRSVAGG
jgi:hypothetical protein